MRDFVPDSTAVRVALWRAMHLQVDTPPHILKDEVGLQLVDPPDDWRERPDMHPKGTAPFRASIVARARFIEDFVTKHSAKPHSISQYVILGSGLDTFAQRHPETTSSTQVFEVEKPDTLAWKNKRLIELGYQIPASLHFVPVNFEDGWWNQLVAAGFNPKEKAVVTSIGVSMYLTRDAILATLRQMKKLAPGSTFIMTFMLPLELVDLQDKPGYEMSLNGAQRSGTPFISFFSPQEMLSLAGEIGFQKLEHLSTSDLMPKYFAGRTDGLRPSTGEEFLIATI